MEAVQELLEEIADNQDGFIATNRVYNKPSLISISSADRDSEPVNQTPYSQTAFSSFSVNLPRPALDVDSIQLMSSNLPMCNNNIPDTAAVFWYYRLSLYSGIIPNSNNLFMNRLLPSYYKPEFVNNASVLAFNKTFLNYTALSTEMAKASANDLAYDNWTTLIRPTLEGTALETTTNAYIPFAPNDFLVSYNSTFNKFQGTGLSVSPTASYYVAGATYNIGAVIATPLNYSPYNAGTTYAVGDIVIVNYALYRSKTAGNVGNAISNTTYWKNIGDLLFWNRPQTWISLQASNTNHPPASSPTWWKEVGVEYIQTWDTNTAYPAGRYVTYANNNVIYKSNALSWGEIPSTSPNWDAVTLDDCYTYFITGPQDPNVVPAQAGVDPFVPKTTYSKLLWNQYALYEVGDRVEYEGQLWRCVQQNQNATPIQVDTIWDAITAYDAGDIVRYRGVVYQARVIVSVYDPENYPAYWEEITYWGWDNCSWNSTITYYRDDAVIFDGLYYRLNVASSTNQQPNPNSNVRWTNIDPDAFSAPAYGLYTTSKVFDFAELDVDDELLLPFPVGIQPQPFNPVPRRLLNSITGFTFNGIFNADAFSAITSAQPAERVILSQFTSQYNRLRPVPVYDAVSGTPILSLRDPVSTATKVYTADGYCNLVYSSIVSTYCDVVGPSSIDTQRATNLLAVNTMNCGNLGISFYAPYLDNPLTKVQNNIYTIFVEFRDEFGDPYYFTNNAVVTLTFKMTYKK